MIAYHKPSTLVWVNVVTVGVMFLVGLILSKYFMFVGVAIGKAFGEALRGILVMLIGVRGLRRVSASG